MSELINVSEIFGEDVFSDKVMQERLPKKVYKELKRQSMKEHLWISLLQMLLQKQ